MSISERLQRLQYNIEVLCLRADDTIEGCGLIADRSTIAPLTYLAAKEAEYELTKH